MNKRKRYIVDKKFQLKTAFSIIGFVTLLTILIIIAISSSVAYNNDKIQKIIKVEDQIFQTLTVISLQNDKNKTHNATIGKMSTDHVNNLNATGKIIQYNKILLILLLIFIIVQGIILYILIIKKTHKISGPIYVMSGYFKDIINGKLPNPRPLRKGDELGEFYTLFAQVVSKLKERKNT